MEHTIWVNHIPKAKAHHTVVFSKNHNFIRLHPQHNQHVVKTHIPGTQMTLVFIGKGPCFGGLKPKNRGQRGSRYILLLLCPLSDSKMYHHQFLRPRRPARFPVLFTGGLRLCCLTGDLDVCCFVAEIVSWGTFGDSFFSTNI